MATTNLATWKRTKSGWQILVEFRRVWEAPNPGTGKGRKVSAKLVRKGEYESRVEPQEFRLTSRVFERNNRRYAFAEEVE